MELKQFEQKMIRELTEIADPGVRVEARTLYRNNDCRKNALCIRREGDDAAPVFFMDEYLGRYQRGEPIRDLASEIWDKAVNGRRPELRAEDILQWEKMKGSVRLVLVNREKNRERIKDVPVAPVLDLGIVCRLSLEGFGSSGGQALVGNAHLKQWGISVRELFAAGWRNMLSGPPAAVLPIQDLIDQLVCGSGEEVFHGVPSGTEEEADVIYPMFVLTNEQRYLGAVSALCPGVLRNLAQASGWNRLYLIPSSVHEMILLPASDTIDAREIISMIREINREVVAEEDRLSDFLYCYDAGTDRIGRLDGSPESAAEWVCVTDLPGEAAREPA